MGGKNTWLFRSKVAYCPVFVTFFTHTLFTRTILSSLAHPRTYQCSIFLLPLFLLISLLLALFSVLAPFSFLKFFSFSPLFHISFLYDRLLNTKNSFSIFIFFPSPFRHGRIFTEPYIFCITVSHTFHRIHFSHALYLSLLDREEYNNITFHWQRSILTHFRSLSSGSAYCMYRIINHSLSAASLSSLLSTYIQFAPYSRSPLPPPPTFSFFFFSRQRQAGEYTQPGIIKTLRPLGGKEL